MADPLYKTMEEVLAARKAAGLLDAEELERMVGNTLYEPQYRGLPDGTVEHDDWREGAW